MRTIHALLVMTLAACSNPPVAPSAGDPMASAAPPATPSVPDTPSTPATPATPTTPPMPSTPPTPSTPPVASTPPDAPPVQAGSVSVTGTVDGVAFTAKDALMTFSALSGGRISGSSATVSLTDFGNACATLKASPDQGNFTAVAIVLASSADGATAPPIPTGTIRIPTNVTKGASASIRFVTIDAKGHPAKKLDATSGTITLTASTPTRLAGSFDVKFANGALKGTFDSPVCPGLK